ncbi:Mrp/NBP35 family ATP-binding protein [Corynebacterium pseudodiphtheriticum]|uniref:Mrp/NBP35 family ATP-binding protein n=1 Tax=Corynebacterium pseudodiphtheriticum TaxID=37637 RepID=UPI0020C0FBC5|nr:Mrp/NBP35 family ATP-binding protein [Corynebacterium pseudodiphtheriticum]MDK8479033.1 Mrp/NBP35 family ATP-binding protein [Corynebacterium pseudodiphtheriticum]MDK8545780.1 Mrp/NBP35 family ATP-binding protein [Corynebacterium pseudodiphtheriticum]MDK8551879.1 Mrp/NBP35 family ATP-binding protein [Corynebacterium pseudodiphtheriticum]MDK8577789.1 Mrp/NBP35 family ATP-binding protein [Corynebacterium pseudodiphtheriticum]MDK8685766.1 Mrp/NBP35 family ATP-binding protein [Corynebacterium p
MSAITESAVREALARVEDPEIGKPITDLGMVKSITIDGADVNVEVYLTISGCPMKSTIQSNTQAAVAEVDGVENVSVSLDVMSDEQRRELRNSLRGSQREPEIPFSKPESTTRVFAVASGKGGVGKSSMTVNLGAALANQGLKVGIVDADIYGHSVPNLLGSTEAPTVIDDMLMPPQAHNLKFISIGQFVEGNAPVVWRGPMLHRAIQQFLADVFWGDLDILLLDLPPGTGDIALSVAQLIPNAELLVVTTPQAAAAEVAERAGSLSQQTRQRVAGVIENMSAMVMPDGSTMDIFGSGGGEIVAQRLTTLVGTEVPLLGQVPLDPPLRSHSDEGTPVVLGEPDSPAAKEITKIAAGLAKRRTSLAGKPLNLGVN